MDIVDPGGSDLFSPRGFADSIDGLIDALADADPAVVS